VFKLGENTNN